MAEKENKKAENKPEEAAGVVLSPEEMAQLRKVLEENAKKDAKIEELSGVVEALRGEVNNISGQKTDPNKKERKVIGYFARIRKYGEKYIVGYTPRGVYQERDQRGDLREYIDVIVHGEKDPVKLSYLEYINNCPQVIVKIKQKKELDAKVENFGEVDKVVFDEKTGQMISMGYSVPLEVETKRYAYEIELPDGTAVELPERFLNM